MVPPPTAPPLILAVSPLRAERRYLVNKYFCVAITFWQYVKLGFKEFFKDPKPSPKKSFLVNLRDSLIGVLSGMVIGLFILWLFVILNINLIALVKFCMWLIGIAVIIDLLFLIGFLFVSWRKAVRDCWDKFQAV